MKPKPLSPRSTAVAGASEPGVYQPPASNHSSREITLTDLDVMPATDSVPLAAMTPAQLGDAFARLTKVEESCVKLSGVVATLKGLVLLEAKRKLPHGRYIPWLKEHFPKSRQTAAQYTHLAHEFAKCKPSLTFETLERDLSLSLTTLEENRLDLAHPIVAQVAAWTEGRSSYQLFLDLGTNERGGDHRNPDKKKLTPAEQRDALLAACREDFLAMAGELDALVGSGKWKAPTISEVELDLAVSLAEKFAAEAKAWLKVPQNKRTHFNAGEVDE